uniref:Uncharacterized protein n=1 Tax=Morchella brunnea TaxID=1174671 RepID=A0A8K1I5J6_9PEZI|nr:hypothetical protein LK370_mgp250 [Morchella brunnea]UBU98420.1 hypothetical protein [Morchella brunnea]
MKGVFAFTGTLPPPPCIDPPPLGSVASLTKPRLLRPAPFSAAKLARKWSRPWASHGERGTRPRLVGIFIWNLKIKKEFWPPPRLGRGGGAPGSHSLGFAKASYNCICSCFKGQCRFIMPSEFS